MRNIGSFITAGVGFALLVAGCTSASGVQLTPAVPAITVAPSNEAPQHVDPSAPALAPFTVTNPNGVVIQVIPNKEGAEVVDTVCGNAITTRGSLLATLGGVNNIKPAAAYALAVGDQMRFSIPALPDGNQTVITDANPLKDGDVAPSVAGCADLHLLVEDWITKQIGAAAIAKPVIICAVTYYDIEHVALTTLQEVTYLAPMDSGRNVLPGETVQLVSDDGATVRVDGTPSPIHPEDCSSYAA